MKDILFLLVLTVVAIGGITAAKKPQPSSQTKSAQVPTSEVLRWYAQQAKSEGRRTVTIPSRQMEYSGDSTAISLDEALRVSTVVLAQLVEKKS